MFPSETVFPYKCKQSHVFVFAAKYIFSKTSLVKKKENRSINVLELKCNASFQFEDNFKICGYTKFVLLFIDQSECSITIFVNNNTALFYKKGVCPFFEKSLKLINLFILIKNVPFLKISSPVSTPKIFRKGVCPHFQKKANFSLDIRPFSLDIRPFYRFSLDIRPF